MKIFRCDACDNLIFFENVSCLRCNHALGFIPDRIDLCSVDPTSDGLLKLSEPTAGTNRYRRCQNGTEYQICNWLISANDPNPLCPACRLNLVIPDLGMSGHLEKWHKLELAKRRVIYTLLRLRLPTEAGENVPPLRFRFLAEEPGGPAVMTGHADGVITMNIAEADDAERERRRVNLHEPLRTLIGHFRHEIAHYYWERLVARSAMLGEFRRIFGDERQDYAAALKKHYGEGPPADWQSSSVSPYATAHPWEDWAETWAHYFHIIDTLETAASFGLSLRPDHPQAATMQAKPIDPEEEPGFENLLENWIPLTHALNELNRGMGLKDIYPFVLSERAIKKLAFVDRTIKW